MRAAIVLLLLVLVLPAPADAARGRTEHSVVVRFEDARTALVETRVVATETHSSALRNDFDVDGDGEVTAVEATTERCWRVVNGLAGRFDLTLDTYASLPARVSCDPSGVVTRAEDGSRTLRYVERYASALARAYVIDVRSDDRLGVIEVRAPAGRAASLAEPTDSFVVEGTVARATGLLNGPWALVAHFPPSDSLFWSAQEFSTELRLEEPGTILVEHVHRSRGAFAVEERALLDADRDGALSDAEIASIWHDPRAALRAPLRLGATELVPVEATTAREGFSATIDDAGEAVTRIRFRYAAPLSPDGFALSHSPWPGAWSAVSTGGRELTHDAGLSSAMVSGGGSQLAGIASGLEEVLFRASPEAGGAPPPMPEPEPAAPEGARARTTALVLATAADALDLRWTIEDVRTGVAARDFRTSLDSDADNQVSADEAASFERGLRLVPPPAAWPFRLDERAPTATTVHEVRVIGLEGASNSLEELRIVTVYGASYAATSGVLRADPLDHGARVSIRPPDGIRLDPASATLLDDVRLDGAVLSGSGAERAWSVVIPAPAAPAPVAAPAPATPASDAPSTADPPVVDATPPAASDPATDPAAPDAPAPTAAPTAQEAPRAGETPAASRDDRADTPGLPLVLILLAAMAAILVRKEH